MGSDDLQSIGYATGLFGKCTSAGGAQTESSRAQWSGATLVITTSSSVVDRGAGKPFTSELTRKLWLESPTTLIVEVTRAGAVGGPPSTTRAVYRKAAP